MPLVRYALPGDAPKQLVATWKGSFKEFALTMDGGVVLSAPQVLHDELRAELPDGGKVRVAVRQGHLVVLVGGTALAVVGDDPESRLRNAYGVIYAISGFTALAAVAGMVWPNGALRSTGLGWTGVAASAVFATLARLVQLRRSRTALGFAIGLTVVDAVALAVVGTGGMHSMAAPAAIAIAKLALIRMMSGGFEAITELEHKASETTR